MRFEDYPLVQRDTARFEARCPTSGIPGAVTRDFVARYSTLDRVLLVDAGLASDGINGVLECLADDKCENVHVGCAAPLRSLSPAPPRAR